MIRAFHTAPRRLKRVLTSLTLSVGLGSERRVRRTLGRALARSFKQISQATIEDPQTLRIVAILLDLRWLLLNPTDHNEERKMPTALRKSKRRGFPIYVEYAVIIAGTISAIMALLTMR